MKAYFLVYIASFFVLQCNAMDYAALARMVDRVSLGTMEYGSTDNEYVPVSTNVLASSEKSDENDDDIKISPEQSLENKTRFIRYVFTQEKSWKLLLAAKKSSIVYREATTVHQMPKSTTPPLEISQFLFEYARKNNIESSELSIQYKRDNRVYIACENKSIHVFNLSNGDLVHQAYIPPCHNRKIESMVLIGSDMLAVAGGLSITIVNLSDTTRYARMNFDSLPLTTIFNGITVHHGALIVETTEDKPTAVPEQFIIYPYNKTMYDWLHGEGLSKYDIEVIVKAAYAIYQRTKVPMTDPSTQFTLTSDEDNFVYKKLPTLLRTYIENFL